MTELKEWVANGTWLSKMTYQAAWGLTDIITNLGNDLQGIEIGVNRGHNTFMLLDACPNIKKIIGVDPFEEYMDWRSMVAQADMDAAYDCLQQNISLFGDRFELLKMKSCDAAAQLQDESFDFVFVDGDHSIKAVLSDLDHYVQKVRIGGVLAGHDIGLNSVNTALRGWCRRKLIDPSTIHIIENQAWYWIKQ